MKKLTILGLLITLCPAMSFAQDVVSEKDLYVSNDKIIYDNRSVPLKPFTGIVKYNPKTNKVYALSSGFQDWFNNGSVPSVEASIKNGKKDGKWKVYEDDTVVTEYNFKDGYLDGTTVKYDKYHPGELSEKSEYKMNKCIKTIQYREGKPIYAYKVRSKEEQEKIAKMPGMHRPSRSPVELETCNSTNSIKEQYSASGKVRFSEDKLLKVKNWYSSEGKLYIHAEPVDQKYRSKADSIYTVYYDDGKIMLRLTVKGDKAIGGELYTKDNKKTILNEQQATDYLMDIAFSTVIGGLNEV